LRQVDYASLRPLAPAEGKTVPDRIVEHFIARIFTGELAPGERLPPDRELAPLLGVDRTSLRMAMQQLARVGLVKVVHGSGVRVLDFREHAGLDFLAAVFALPGLSLGSSYLLQMLEDWIDLIPVLAGRAFARMTHEQRREVDALMGEQLAVLDESGRGRGPRDLARLVELEIALQDRMLRIAGNTGLILLGNSSRPLRRHMVQLFFDATDVRQHVSDQRALFRQVTSHSRVSADDVAKGYRAYLVERTAALRKRLLALPVNPTLAPTGATRVTRVTRATRASAAPKRKAPHKAPASA
jgi:GntR family transcriptional regulator, transcriptional repressor for pyruvate dehydrogenase complex